MQDWREEFGDQRLVEMLRQQPPQEGSSCRPSLQGMPRPGRGGGGDTAGIGEAVTRRSSLWNWPSGNHFELRLGPAIVTAEGK